MKKLLLIGLSALALLIVTVVVLREPLKDVGYEAITRDMFVDADTDGFDPGPALGSRFPGVTALYKGERVSLIEPFAGPRGTVFMASRSFDWCPYCMAQMLQLNKAAADFAAAGIGLVAITYDSPGAQAAFAEEHDIVIPMLSDIDALSFKTLGILNAQYQPGEHHYGIPYPGSIVVDPEGIVVGKVFLEAYSARVSADKVLEYAEAVLGEQEQPSE